MYPDGMKRLTISGEACVETLSLLITMAWADGRLDEHEKESIRAAADVLNLTKELRQRLDKLLQSPITLDELLLDELTPHDKAFAYVAAAWMSAVDSKVDAKEEQLLGKLALMLGLTKERREDLTTVARDLEPLRKSESSWATELVTLFKAIPERLEGDGTESFDVSFE